jgi:hypothetical protein
VIGRPRQNCDIALPQRQFRTERMLERGVPLALPVLFDTRLVSLH